MQMICYKPNSNEKSTVTQRKTEHHHLIHLIAAAPKLQLNLSDSDFVGQLIAEALLILLTVLVPRDI